MPGCGVVVPEQRAHPRHEEGHGKQDRAALAPLPQEEDADRQGEEPRVDAVVIR